MEHVFGRRTLTGRATWVAASALAMLCALSQRTAAQNTNPGITGTVRYYSTDAAVPGVVVQLSGAEQSQAVTDAGGGYAFSASGSGGWQITPAKTGGLNGAVSALDASWVLQAVVGMRQLSPNQALACDVTGDGTVSALDAARILQLVAGMRTRFPVAEACGSDWAFVPAAAQAPGERLAAPQVAPMCAPGAIDLDSLASPVAAQDFLAVLFGDCTGNWQAGTAATPTASGAPGSATPTRPPSPTASVTATPSRTGTATRAATPSPTVTSTRTPLASATATRTAVPTATARPSATVTSTFTPLSTSTQTRTLTATRTVTATRTSTLAPTATDTASATSTRTGTRTATPTSTLTPSPTPTATCARGLAWTVSSPVLVSAQSGGNLWLAKSVPTDLGWGLFWLRQDPDAPNFARLYYAHVDFDGQTTVGPLRVINIPEIPFRGHYYFAAWNQDHYGLLISNQATLYYYDLSRDGVLSGQKVVPVLLFVSSEYDEESDGDVEAFPGGFLGVIEGDCGDGHSCSYAYKLDRDGNSLTSPINLVDFDFTHQFYPRSAFDGAGFAILSVKDILISGGGVMTKYLSSNGVLSANAKVVPAKEYLWDEFPDIAWNGDHFAAVWTENSARSDTAPWQIHFASFRRTKAASTLIADRVIDVVAQKTNQRWTTQMHAVGADWVAQYASRAADNSIVAVYELLGDDTQTRASIQPFPLSADALGSSPHFATGHVGELGIVRGSNLAQGTEVTFQTLPPPACAP
jgi:hypothetical protein